MFRSQFFFGEAQHGAEGTVYEERLPFEVLDGNPDRARVEDVTENLGVMRPSSKF